MPDSFLLDWRMKKEIKCKGLESDLTHLSVKNINLWQPWLRVKVPWRLLCYCYPNGLPLNNTVRRGRGRKRGGALTRKY